MSDVEVSWREMGLIDQFSLIKGHSIPPERYIVYILGKIVSLDGVIDDEVPDKQ